MFTVNIIVMLILIGISALVTIYQIYSGSIEIVCIKLLEIASSTNKSSLGTIPYLNEKSRNEDQPTYYSGAEGNPRAKMKPLLKYNDCIHFYSFILMKNKRKEHIAIFYHDRWESFTIMPQQLNHRKCQSWSKFFDTL